MPDLALVCMLCALDRVEEEGILFVEGLFCLEEVGRGISNWISILLIDMVRGRVDSVGWEEVSEAGVEIDEAMESKEVGAVVKVVVGICRRGGGAGRGLRWETIGW